MTYTRKRMPGVGNLPCGTSLRRKLVFVGFRQAHPLHLVAPGSSRRTTENVVQAARNGRSRVQILTGFGVNR
jgi:hypothetical protein